MRPTLLGALALAIAAHPGPSLLRSSSSCTGSSVNLTAGDCSTWQEIYDHGHGWQQCSRSDPCSCDHIRIGCGPALGLPVPWLNASDCTPACVPGVSMCCRDPQTINSTGACFAVPTCSVLVDPPAPPPPGAPWHILGMVFDPDEMVSSPIETLSGTIPAALGNLTELVQLIISDNHLSGSVPESMSKLTKLSQLFLSYNRLSGSLPSSLSALENVGALMLQCNDLTGALPALPFDKIKICDANHQVGLGSNCSASGRTDNTFSCPLPDGAAEHCHAKCV